MSDSILEGFGEPIVEVDEKEFEDKLKKISPFDFVNSINYSKENLIVMATVRKAKRYNKWIKAEESNIEAIQKFFGYSFMKAKEALKLLNEDQIDRIKLHLAMSQGGQKVQKHK